MGEPIPRERIPSDEFCESIVKEAREAGNDWRPNWSHLVIERAWHRWLDALDDPAVLGMTKYEDLGPTGEPGQSAGRITVDVAALRRYLSGGADDA